MLVSREDQGVGEQGGCWRGMRRVAVTASLLAGQRKYVVMLLGANVSTVGLIVRSSGMAMMRGGCLLTAVIHRKHWTTVCSSGDLGRLDVNLYLLTGSLILVVVDGITDVGCKIVLGVLSALSSWPAEGPSVSTESRARIAGSGTHIRESCNGWVSLARRAIGRPLWTRQRTIFRTNPFHYNKLICGKYFESFQVNVPVTLQYLGVGERTVTRVSYPSTRIWRRTLSQIVQFCVCKLCCWTDRVKRESCVRE